MQTPQPNSAATYILNAAALALAAGIGSFFSWLFTRKKVNPEIDGINAKATLDRAQARHLDAETVDRAFDRIDDLTEIIASLRVENTRLQGVEVANEILTAWNTRMKSTLEANGIRVPAKWESAGDT